MTVPSPRPVRVLITGGSSGIGLALAQVYTARGFDVFRIGKRSESPGVGEYASIDLSAVGASDQVLAALDARGWNSFDILILNAGLGYVGVIENTPAKSTTSMIGLNALGPLELAHALLPRVTHRITFIGSTAFNGTNPAFAIYAATKAALRGAVRSWQVERNDALPLVQIIHPGPTESDMHDRAGMGDIPIRRLFTPAPIVAQKIAKLIDGSRLESRFGPFFMLRHAIGKIFL